MPIYEYKCSDCEKKFEELLTNSNQKINCPECQSDNISKLLSVFSASSSSSSSVQSLPCGQNSCNSGFS